jgi:putative transposase
VEVDLTGVALLQVLDELHAAEVGDRVRPAAETIYHVHRPPAAGDLELRIPKIGTGSFLPSLLERRRRVEQALFA